MLSYHSTDIAHAYTCNVNTRIEVVHTTCCAIAALPWLYVRESTHTTHTRLHHDQTCMAVVHTRIVVVSVDVSSSSKQSKKDGRRSVGFQHTDPHAPTHAHTYHSTHRTNTDITVTTYAGGNRQHGLLHSTHSSLWCCCYSYCAPARLRVDVNKATLGGKEKS